MNKTNNLYLEYARVIEMCERLPLENAPWLCVKIDGDVLQNPPSFECDPDLYTFAIAVLEGKPVFVGDSVCSKETGIIRKITSKNLILDFQDKFSWQPPKPKRTFELDGVVLPCPIVLGQYSFECSGHLFGFDTFNDMQTVRDAVSNLLYAARDKP